jgi:hypothetical protein
MLDSTTEAGGRAERRLWEEGIAWVTMVRADANRSRCPSGFCGRQKPS